MGRQEFRMVYTALRRQRHPCLQPVPRNGFTRGRRLRALARPSLKKRRQHRRKHRTCDLFFPHPTAALLCPLRRLLPALLLAPLPAALCWMRSGLPWQGALRRCSRRRPTRLFPFRMPKLCARRRAALALLRRLAKAQCGLRYVVWALRAVHLPNMCYRSLALGVVLPRRVRRSVQPAVPPLSTSLCMRSRGRVLLLLPGVRRPPPPPVRSPQARRVVALR